VGRRGIPPAPLAWDSDDHPRRALLHLRRLMTKTDGRARDKSRARSGPRQGSALPIIGNGLHPARQYSSSATKGKERPREPPQVIVAMAKGPAGSSINQAGQTPSIKQAPLLIALRPASGAHRHHRKNPRDLPLRPEADPRLGMPAHPPRRAGEDLAFFQGRAATSKALL